MTTQPRNMIDVVVPEAPAPTSGNAIQPKLRGSLASLRIGVLDNSKGNADHLLGMLVDGLRAELPVASVRSLRKVNPSHAAPVEILDQLAHEADFVFSAMAD